MIKPLQDYKFWTPMPDFNLASEFSMLLSHTTKIIDHASID